MAERILGIDYGDVRVGLAVSDGLGLTAQPLPFMPGGGRRRITTAIAELCRERQIGRIVIGLPRHLNGDEGETAGKVRLFGEMLAEQSKLPVIYVDERLTSKAVERLMIDADMSRAKRRERVDSLAAAMILQNWLDAQAYKPTASPPPASPESPM